MFDAIINIEEFEKIQDINLKLNVLFKALVINVEKMDARFEAGTTRFKKLENRKLVDRGYSFIGGIIGGAVAILTKGFFWRN